MRYLLYLRCSLRRRPRRHITLYILLTCALLLPLLASFFRDSAAYGRQQELLARSQGQTFHIQNAEEADTAYFADIPGLSAPEFRDGTVFLRILSDEEWRSSETVAFYGDKVQERADLAGEGRLFVKGFPYAFAHGILTDDTDLSEQRALLYVELLLLAVSVLLLRSAYRSHLGRFSPEIGVLRALGAGRGQIAALFLAEFLVMFLLAALSALALSAGAVWLLFRYFLEVQRDGDLSWLMFHIDLRRTGTLLLADFAVLAVMLGHTLARYGRSPALALLRGERRDQGVPNIKRKPLRLRRSPGASLAGLWRQRTNRSFQDCLLVSVPITTAFLLLLTLLLLNAQAAAEQPAYAIGLTKENADWLGGFTGEEIADIRSMDGVAAVKEVRRIREDRYQVRSASAPQSFDVPDDPQARLLPYSGLEEAAPEGLGRYEAVVSTRQEGSSFAAGDELLLRRMNEDGYPEDETIRLTVVETVDVPVASWAVDVYLSDALYGELAAREPVGTVEVALDRPEIHEQVAAALRERFGGSGYEISDRQAGAEALERSVRGMYLLLCCLFCAMFLLMAVILSAKLRDYVDGCRDMARTLYAVGGDKRELYASYMGQTAAMAAAAAALPLILCAPLWCVAALSGGVWPPSGSAAAAVAAALVLMAYLLPVRSAARDMLKQL